MIEDDQPPASVALHELLTVLEAAQREFDRACSAEERRAQLTCPCDLCDAMRTIRQCIADYKRMRGEPS